MKQRNMRNTLLSWVLVMAIVLCAAASFLPMQANAASSGEIKKQLEQLKQDKEAIAQQIEKLKGQIDENQTQMEKMVQQKNIIDQEIALKYEEIANINEQISAYKLLIADKQEALTQAEESYIQLNEKNRERIRAMEENPEVNYWEVLFQANSFADFLDRINMVREIAAADRRRLQELNAAAETVAAAKQALEAEKTGLEATKSELDAAQMALEEKRREADRLLNDLIATGAEFEALLEDSEEKQTQLLLDIAKKQSEYDNAKYREWLATSVPSTKPTTGGNGGSNTGSVKWKVPIRYTRFSSPFGYRTHPKTGKWTMHYGVDLAAPTNTPIYASRAGTVSIAAYQHNGAGHYVQINHGDGYRSIYMHMTRYVVKVGQKVSQGQLIGYCGSSGLSSGPHLHFGISYKGTYVNPANYINI